MSMNYDAWAEWYDVFYSTAGVDDVEFYVDLAVRSGGPVLEIGCLSLLPAGEGEVEGEVVPACASRGERCALPNRLELPVMMPMPS